MTTNMAYSNSRIRQLQQGGNLSSVMVGLLRTPPSFDNAQGYEFPDGSQRNYTHGVGYDNPYWTLNKNYLDERVNRFTGNAIMNLDFTEWFSASYNIGLDAYTRRQKDVIAVGSGAERAGSVAEGTFVSRQFNADLLLNFSRNFGAISADLVLGHNMFSTGWEELTGEAHGLEIPDFYNLSNSADPETGLSGEKYRTTALFYDLNLAYADMIFLEAGGLQ